jgi:hypothetical protein
LFNRLLYTVPAKLLLAYVAAKQQAFVPLFLDQTPRLVRILVFFKVHDCNVSAFLGECDGNSAADAAIAARNDRHLVLQFSTAAMLFVLGSWPRLHFVFAAGLPSLVLRRLKFLLFGHASSARRASQYLSAGASACAPLSLQRVGLLLLLA